ncbi:hypothetical protein T12_9474 [Trichinella patagoniensis]|uniref:Uncharacterized protein n=1 Tax=Trichinella patagoniensis TaxID=990121 RepID=A0A0V0ZT91_9BILA|nr:hypothetical protein T12_9474 [Trichinella patagoniensis]
MSIESRVFGGRVFSDELQNLMGYGLGWFCENHCYSYILIKDSASERFSGAYLNIFESRQSQQRLLPDRVLTPTDFHHLPSRLSQPRTKLYCSEISLKLFPDYYDRRTTEQTCSNVYIHSDFSIDIDLVKNRELVEWKCICGGYWKIVSVNQIDLFEGLTRDFGAWQKIIRRLVVRKQVEKALIKLMIAGLAAPQLQCSQ